MKKYVLATLAIVVLLLGSVVIAKAFTGSPAGSVRGVVALIGDSNIVKALVSINQAMSPSEVGYVPISIAVPRAGIRWNGCGPSGTGICPDQTFNDYWQVRIPEVRQRVNPDAYVVELGIADASILGTATSRGYASYGNKIDYIMNLLPTDKPVLWTNLPCPLEPDNFKTGCQNINFALAYAQQRWPNLTVVNWLNAARSHPEYMIPGDIHYTPAGYNAYAQLVISELNAKLP